MAVQIPAQAILDAKTADSDLWQLLLAIAGPESGYRSDAVGDAGCSLGYLQFNTCGGLGNGHSQAELFNGANNFRLGAQYIKGRMANGASLYEALQPWSARDLAWALYDRIRSEGIEGEGSVLAGNGSGGTLILIGAMALLLIVLS
jgi:hypothetical protein